MREFLKEARYDRVNTFFSQARSSQWLEANKGKGKGKVTHALPKNRLEQWLNNLNRFVTNTMVYIVQHRWDICHG